jgi:hypothetical protein
MCHELRATVGDAGLMSTLYMSVLTKRASAELNWQHVNDK